MGLIIAVTLDHSKVCMLPISVDHAGQRLDNFLLARLKGVPKSLIYKIIRKGEVRVNKKRVKPEYRLVSGDQLRVPPVRTAETKPTPQPGESLQAVLRGAVLYDDADLLVVNKPPGLAVHGGSGIRLGLIEALRKIYPECRFLELVHRLDRETSGCVMVAKKRRMLVHLQSLLRQDHGIDKRYLALVKGGWDKKCRLVEAPLRKNELLSGERIVKVHVEGKPSRTGFKLLSTYRDVSLVEAVPLTGRTHQIRVHALHRGHPLIGDEKYGDKAVNKQMKTLGFKRLFLHAHQLVIPLPDGGELELVAPLPADLSLPLSKLTR